MNRIATLALLLTFWMRGTGIHAQKASQIPTDPDEITRIILAKDSAFWQAYNTCDMAAFPSFLTEDLEFYHDKGGLTDGRAALIKGMAEGLCSNTDNFQLRRAPIPGTVRVFPLAKYGAIITGEHVFYVNEKGKEEFLDGQDSSIKLRDGTLLVAVPG